MLFDYGYDPISLSISTKSLAQRRYVLATIIPEEPTSY